MEFVKTKRGARALLNEGYRYVINRRGRDERIFWRCSKSRTCSGSLCTLDDQIISSRKDQHNHPPDEAETEVEKIVDSMKDKVRTTAQPIPAVYNLREKQKEAIISFVQTANDVASHSSNQQRKVSLLLFVAMATVRISHS